jgi:hypothetical protein
MPRIFPVVGVLLLFATMGSAQLLPKGNVFIGYSYTRADVAGGNNANLDGWNGSLEGKIFPYVGIVADLSGVYGGTNSPAVCPVLSIPGPCTSVHTTIHQYNVLFGPRLSVSVGKVRPFAHALFGAAHENLGNRGGSSSDTSFATALGGGVDYKAFHVAAWRFEGDYLQTRYFSGTQSDFRFSTGLVFNF